MAVCAVALLAPKALGQGVAGAAGAATYTAIQDMNAAATGSDMAAKQAKYQACLTERTSVLSSSAEEQDSCIASATSNVNGTQIYGQEAYIGCVKRIDQAKKAIMDNITQQCRKEAGLDDNGPVNPNGAPNGASCPLGGCPANVPMPLSRPANLGQKTTPKSTPTKKVAGTDNTNNTNNNNSQESVSQAQAEAQGDISSCSSLQSSATNCCNNPLNCKNELSQQDQQTLAALQASSNTAPTGTGLTDYCTQMQQLGSSSGQLNNALSAVCAGHQSSCSNTCGSLVQKYQQKLSSCNGCAAQSVYQDALSTLTQYQSTCQLLASRSNALAVQGLASSQNTGAGSACNQLVSATPQSLAAAATPVAANPNDPYGCQTNPNSPACLSCAQNPTMAGCQPANQPTGQAGFAQAQPEPAPSDFNVGDPGAGQQAQTQFAIQPAQPPQVNPIANNSGGAIPGGDGGNANLNPSGSQQQLSMGGSHSTDILQGYRSGGYSQPAGSMNDEGSNSGSPIFHKTASASETKSTLLDLRNFLPGGADAPFRGLAGMSGSPSNEINGMGVDMWSTVSRKYVEKCRLGVLWQCQ